MRYSYCHILFLLAALAISCNSKKQEPATEQSKAAAAPSSSQVMQKSAIDTLFSNSKDKLLVLAKITEDSEAIEIRNAEFPGTIASAINILRDEWGKVICVAEFPYSESGDWWVGQRHYFDAEGKTFAFEQQASQFNSGCTEGAVYETSVGYYDTNFKRTSVAYSLVDEQGMPLQPDQCDLYKFEYIVYPDLETLLEARKINLAQ